jgi:hypothetical protein
MVSFDSIAGFLSAHEGRTLQKLASGKGIVLEIGSFMGKSTCWLASEVKGVVVSIDPFYDEGRDPVIASIPPGLAEHRFRENLKKFNLNHKVIQLKAKSTEVFPFWNSKIDLLFIDGIHQLSNLQEDIRFADFLREKGKVAFHDYGNPSFPDVTNFVDGLKLSNKLRFIKTNDTLAVFERKCPT